jgi:hypothetical protein
MSKILFPVYTKILSLSLVHNYKTLSVFLRTQLQNLAPFPYTQLQNLVRFPAYITTKPLVHNLTTKPCPFSLVHNYKTLSVFPCTQVQNLCPFPVKQGIYIFTEIFQGIYIFPKYTLSLYHIQLQNLVRFPLYTTTVKSVQTVTCLKRSSVLCGHTVFVPQQHILYWNNLSWTAICLILPLIFMYSQLQNPVRFPLYTTTLSKTSFPLYTATTSKDIQ